MKVLKSNIFCKEEEIFDPPFVIQNHKLFILVSNNLVKSFTKINQLQKFLEKLVNIENSKIVKYVFLPEILQLKNSENEEERKKWEEEIQKFLDLELTDEVPEKAKNLEENEKTVITENDLEVIDYLEKINESFLVQYLIENKEKPGVLEETERMINVYMKYFDYDETFVQKFVAMLNAIRSDKLEAFIKEPLEYILRYMADELKKIVTIFPELIINVLRRQIKPYKVKIYAGRNNREVYIFFATGEVKRLTEAEERNVYNLILREDVPIQILLAETPEKFRNGVKRYFENLFEKYLIFTRARVESSLRKINKLVLKENIDVNLSEIYKSLNEKIKNKIAKFIDEITLYFLEVDKKQKLQIFLEIKDELIEKFKKLRNEIFSLSLEVILTKSVLEEIERLRREGKVLPFANPEEEETFILGIKRLTERIMRDVYDVVIFEESKLRQYLEDTNTKEIIESLFENGIFVKIEKEKIKWLIFPKQVMSVFIETVRRNYGLFFSRIIRNLGLGPDHFMSEQFTYSTTEELMRRVRKKVTLYYVSFDLLTAIFRKISEYEGEKILEMLRDFEDAIKEKAKKIEDVVKRSEDVFKKLVSYPNENLTDNAEINWKEPEKQTIFENPSDDDLLKLIKGEKDENE